MATDAVHGFILGGHVTPANRADTTELEKVLEDLDLPPATIVLVDKGYSSHRHREILHRKGFHFGIMARASRNRF